MDNTMTGQILLHQKVGRDHTPERTFWVSNSFDDNPTIGQFSTIQAAITYIHDASWYSDLDDNNYAVILVYPGQYYEQLTSWSSIRVKSLPDDINIGLYKSVQLNPPADKKNEPIFVAGADYRYDIEGFTIMADSVVNGPYAYALRQAEFHNCLFENGSFLENTGSYASDMHFIYCTVYPGTNAFDMTGTRGHTDRYLYFYNTWIYGDIITTSTIASGDAQIEFRDCPCSCKLVTGGDWNLVTKNTRLRNSTGSPNRNTFSTTGCIKLEDTGISGGIHFTSAPSSLCLSNCNFNVPFSTAIVGKDITSDVTISSVSYINNIQQNGITGKIRTDNPVKNLGADSINRYYSLQDAIDAVAIAGVVDLHQSYTSLSEITVTAGKTVSIDGHRIYGLAFSADIIELGTNQKLTLSRLNHLTGGTIEVNGNGAEIHVHNCNHSSEFSILVTSGTGALIHISYSSFVGPTGLSPLQYNSTVPTTEIDYSRLTGATGQPAIEFTVEADSCLKAKFSTLLHGDGGANSPITYTGANKVDMSVYSCGLNAAWNPASFTNIIGAANNTTDPGIDF